MAYTSDIVLGGRFVGLFIGNQGTGKTVAAASFPGPIMFYAFDDRMAPVKRFYPNRKDIQYKTVGAYPSRRRDYIDFRTFCDEFEAFQDRCDFATVVVDSLTSYTATVVRYCLNKKGKDKGRHLAGFIEVPTWDEFNAEAQAVVETIEISKILPAHIIFTAHPVDKTEILKSGGEELVRKTQSITAFGNKTPSFVPPYFDEIYNFRKMNAGGGQDPRRFVTCQAGEDVLCKTALPIPNEMEITNQPFFKILQGHLEAHKLKLAEKVEEQQALQTEEVSTNG